MDQIKESLYSKYIDYGVNENIIIYKGKFFLILDKYKYSCEGEIYYKINTKTSINFTCNVCLDKYQSLIIRDYKSCFIEAPSFDRSEVDIINWGLGTINEGRINRCISKGDSRDIYSINFHILNLMIY